MNIFKQLMWELFGLGLMLALWITAAWITYKLTHSYVGPDAPFFTSVVSAAVYVEMIGSYYLGQRVIGNRGYFPDVFIWGRDNGR